MDVKVYDSDYFETETDIHFLWLEFGIGALLFLPFLLWFVFISPIWIWGVYFLGYFLILAFMYSFSFWKYHVTLVFKGDTLCIMRHWKKEMVTYSEVGREAFDFSQTKREKKRGLGTIYIFGTDYFFSGIKNFDAMRQYIATHFPERGNT